MTLREMNPKVAIPKPGAKGFSLTVLPTRGCLATAIESNGFCHPRLCWHFVAINKLMDVLEPGAKHYVRVDAGHIKVNYRGYRYVADTPAHVKRSLMLFDAGRYDEVRIRQYAVRFRRTSRIEEYTEARKEQLIAARRVRVAEGRDSYAPPPVSLRKRVAGFSSIV